MGSDRAYLRNHCKVAMLVAGLLLASLMVIPSAQEASALKRGDLDVTYAAPTFYVGDEGQIDVTISSNLNTTINLSRCYIVITWDRVSSERYDLSPTSTTIPALGDVQLTTGSFTAPNAVAGTKTFTIYVVGRASGDKTDSTYTQSGRLQLVSRPPLVVALDAQPTGGLIPLSVGFRSTVTGGASPYSYLWDFGDGQTSTQAQVTHVYVRPDNYTVTLTVTDKLRGKVSKTVAIHAFVNPLDATMVISRLTGEAPLEVSFAPNPTEGSGGYSYLWDLGDGSTSTQEAFNHTYAEPGNYTVTLTVTDSIGERVTRSTTVRVVPPFVIQASADSSGQPVRLSASAIGGTPPYSYYWDFGDGSYSTEQSPQHRYKAGEYTAKVTVTDADSRARTFELRIALAQDTSIPPLMVPVLGMFAVGAIVLMALVIRRKSAPEPPTPQEMDRQPPIA